MAIYHFSAKVISRANGSSAVAAAAYRSASRLHDDRLGRDHDFTNKAGVIHSEVLQPNGTPDRWQDRQGLWNEVEGLEKRKDGQLAREIEFAIPRELNQAEAVSLARDFVREQFVERGMVADLNVHWDIGSDGQPKPHAHVMLSMRQAGPDGFGPKQRTWNARECLDGWRERWAEHVNQRLVALGHDVRIDHRSLEAQGLALEPQHKIGPAGARRLDRGEQAERAVEHHAIARRNGERIVADPSLALSAITHQQSTFTTQDLACFIHRHSDDAEQFSKAMTAVRTSPDLVALGQDGRGRDRFTTREMIGVEERMERNAEALADRPAHGVGVQTRNRALASAERNGLRLGEEQADALRHVTQAKDLGLVVGYAGSGKSAMLGVASAAWEAEGYRVRGAALSGIAAESLEAGSGIASRTIASLEHAWGQGRELLTADDVLVIDEAGMIGARQMDRVLQAARDAGAKVVMVGDAEQLQAIEAGAAFRALTERHGAAEISEVRRQQEVWQREATRELATGRTVVALDRYESAGRVHAHATRDDAKAALISEWDQIGRSDPNRDQIILAHTRSDVADLNALARAQLRQTGELGVDQVVTTDRGDRSFATGDRILFLRNERSLGVKNGTLGVVKATDGSCLSVVLAGHGERRVVFDTRDYGAIDHGYATTIHKSQGITVDQTHVLASPGLDRHSAYVALSRHRDAVGLHFGADDFPERRDLMRVLSRERAKDVAHDYPRAFSERRGISQAELRRSRSALELKTDRFVAEWNLLKGDLGRLQNSRVPSDKRLIERRAGAMISAIKRDPELFAALGTRRDQLGIAPARFAGQDIARDLQRSVGLEHGLGL